MMKLRPEPAAIRQQLGVELLVRLLGHAPSEVRRFTAGERPPPDPVAARLRFLELLARDLAGSYNPAGIRRWFDRPQPQFEDRSPAQWLGREWRPDSATALRVRELAGMHLDAARGGS